MCLHLATELQNNMKQNLIELKGEIYKLTNIVGDFNAEYLIEQADRKAVKIQKI